MRWVVLLLFFLAVNNVYSQCSIKSEVQQNGLTFKHTEKELLYTTRSYTLYSAVFHDGEKYYLKIIVRPMKNKKLKKDRFDLELKNGKKHSLDFYDSFEVKKDTSLDLLFRITDDVLQDLTRSDVTSISISLDTGTKRYKLINHHALIRKQLTCMVNVQNKK